jgi:8-oxo-dGTP diphosphatase
MTCERIVTAAIIQKEDCILLARRSAGEKLAGLWEFPGGKVENGESPEECLARELHEELGIGVKVGAKCAESLHQYDHGSFRIVAYFVEWLAGEPQPCVHDRIEWVKIDEISGYELLPADIPIATSLKKLKELPQ